MDSGDEGVIRRAEEAAKSLLDRLGDKVLGPTAESESTNATVIAPDASTSPVTQGRRSRHPDGQDPFRADAPIPDEQAETSK